jgi:hypothetical protein
MKKSLVLALLLAGCVDHLPGPTGTQSLQVQLITPTTLGAPDDRLKPTVQEAQIKVTALDQDGAVDTSVTRMVDVYVQFLGTLTPDHDKKVPLTRIQLTAGVSGVVSIPVSGVFGPTEIWVEDVETADASFALGSTDTLWFRDPYIFDIQTVNPMALDLLSHSPLQDKNVTVTQSKYGAKGRLVVTGVYATGYTVDDVECLDDTGKPPCTAGAFDHAFVYSFSRARDQQGDSVVLGENITGFAGAVSEFKALTEINFPQTFSDAAKKTPNPAQVPLPQKIDSSWFNDVFLFEQNEAGLVEIDNAKLCPLDSTYEKYSQWRLDLGTGCNNSINVVTAGQVPFDPAAIKTDTVIPKVVGTLRPVAASATTMVWIVYPRFSQDLSLP